MVHINFLTGSYIINPFSLFFNVTFQLFDGYWMPNSNFVRPTGEIDCILTYNDQVGTQTQYIIGRNGAEIIREQILDPTINIEIFYA